MTLHQISFVILLSVAAAVCVFGNAYCLTKLWKTGYRGYVVGSVAMYGVFIVWLFT